MSVLSDIQKWYASNCDGEWEHSYGISIDTLDNPGWSITVNLKDTNLEDKNFEPFKNRVSEDRWISCLVKDNKFRGAGDETKLEEILKVFLDWAKNINEDWLKSSTQLCEEELQFLEDAEFINLLGEEIGTELCKSEGCIRKRIENSVMCRRHHFEMVKERSFPDSIS